MRPVITAGGKKRDVSAADAVRTMLNRLRADLPEGYTFTDDGWLRRTRPGLPEEVTVVGPTGNSVLMCALEYGEYPSPGAAD